MIRMLKRLSCAGTRQVGHCRMRPAGTGRQLIRCRCPNGGHSPWLPDATEGNRKKAFQMPFTEKQLHFEMIGSNWEYWVGRNWVVFAEQGLKSKTETLNLRKEYHISAFLGCGVYISICYDRNCSIFRLMPSPVKKSFHLLFKLLLHTHTIMQSHKFCLPFSTDIWLVRTTTVS